MEDTHNTALAKNRILSKINLEMVAEEIKILSIEIIVQL